MAVKKVRYKIVMTFDAPRLLPESVLNEVAGCAFVQLEGITDDHGLPYGNARLLACRQNPNGKVKVPLSPNQVDTLYEALDMLEMDYDTGDEASPVSRKVRRQVKSARDALDRGTA